MISQKNPTVSGLKALSSLLKRAPETSSYFKFLPESTLIQVKTEKSHKNPLPDLSLKELFGKIDDSWYLDVFSKFSTADLAFYLSLFPQKKGRILSDKLSLELPLYSFSHDFEIYSLNLLFNQIFQSAPPLPLSYLPDFPLSFLMEGNSEKLHKLCFYLGLFDVTSELKSVINGAILKQIEKSLFTDEVTFCREISEFRHILSLGLIGLATWNEDSDLLRKVIFERGLYRLSIALSEATDDFIWYIHHMLNKESAIKILNFSKTPNDLKAIGIALEQTLIAWKGIVL